MKEQDKTREQLLSVIKDLRRSNADLIKLDKKRSNAEESFHESEERYRSLVDSTDDSIYVVDREYKYVYMNKKHLTRLGLLGNEFLGQAYGEFHIPREKKKFIKKVDNVFVSNQSSQSEYRSLRDNRYFLQTFSPVHDRDGNVTAVTVVSKDITERKKTDELILQSKQDWENTFNSITDMITVHDRNFNIIRANKSAEKILSLPFLVSETKCFKYYHGKDSSLEKCPSCECLKTGKPSSFEMFEPYLGMFLEIRAIPRYDSNNNLVGLIHVARDITVRKKMEEKLHAMSITDDLTGLLNRRGFFSHAEKQLKLAQRAKREMSVIYADLDGLKAINDTWGHKVGDSALLEIAGLLRETFSESDIVSRLGGDEFAVLVEITGTDDEAVVKKRLEEQLDRFNSMGKNPYKLLISVGMVRFDPDNPCSIDELLSRSDKLMYANKKSK